jgi:hypothetical protein
VVLGHAQAQFCVRCKAPVRRHHRDRRRLVGVGGREDDFAVKYAALKVGACRALEHKVPLEQVAGGRVRADVRDRLLFCVKWVRLCGRGVV